MIFETELCRSVEVHYNDTPDDLEITSIIQGGIDIYWDLSAKQIDILYAEIKLQLIADSREAKEDPNYNRDVHAMRYGK